MSQQIKISDITIGHLWRDNPALTRLLGLCPMLAVTQSVVQAVGLGLSTIFVLMGSSLAASLTRKFIPSNVRLPTFVMIIASFTTCATLIMQAYAFTLYQTMALFVQIIVTNCLILSRIEVFSSRHPPLVSLLDSFMTGLGFALALISLGALREVLAYGTLGARLDLLFGPIASDWWIELAPGYEGFLLAALPPGAFLGMGLLIALKNSLSLWHQKPLTDDTGTP